MALVGIVMASDLLLDFLASSDAKVSSAEMVDMRRGRDVPVWAVKDTGANAEADAKSSAEAAMGRRVILQAWRSPAGVGGREQR